MRHLLSKSEIFVMPELTNELLDLGRHVLLRAIGRSNEPVQLTQFEKPADATNASIMRLTKD